MFYLPTYVHLLCCTVIAIFFRPSQFFRKCDTGADRRAKTRYHEWSAAGQLFHPRVEVFINNIEECLPEVWKVTA